MRHRIPAWHRRAIIGLAIVALALMPAPPARAAGGHATFGGNAAAGQTRLQKGVDPYCAPGLPRFVRPDAAVRGKVQVDYGGKVDCNFYLSGYGLAYLINRTDPSATRTRTSRSARRSTSTRTTPEPASATPASTDKHLLPLLPPVVDPRRRGHRRGPVLPAVHRRAGQLDRLRRRLDRGADRRLDQDDQHR